MKNRDRVAECSSHSATLNKNNQYRLTPYKCYHHFLTILRHKKEVFKLCCVAGIPLQGIVHDMSKFSPTEFLESAAYFQGTKSPILAIKEDKGVCVAWLHHKGRNMHHWEYWVDNYIDGGIPGKMPYKYALEMVCDVIAASKVYNKEKFTKEMPLEYFRNSINEHIHTDTVKFALELFEAYAKMGDRALRRSYTKKLYASAC